jgi:hypothetical protein
VAPIFTVAPGWTFTDWDKAFNNVSGNLIVTAQYIEGSVDNGSGLDFEILPG